jgi:hypothetical protein
VVRVPSRIPIQPGNPSHVPTSGQPPTQPVGSQRVHPIPPRLTDANRTWPSISTTTTDLTTPSLCSDNEGEVESSTRSEERQLHTPPLLIDAAAPATQKRHSSSRLAPSPEPIKHIVFNRNQPKDALKKRLPPSKLLETPRKPKPPRRRSASSVATHKPTERISHYGEDDALLLNFSPYSNEEGLGKSVRRVLRVPSPLPALNLGLGTKPQRASAPTKPITATAGHVSVTSREKPHFSKRDLNSGMDILAYPSGSGTLDHELHQAFVRGGQDLVEVADDLDSGVLVGVGMRSKKRGFLARGGAGGAPVFMGVGYVDGVEESDEEADTSMTLPADQLHPGNRTWSTR